MTPLFRTQPRKKRINTVVGILAAGILLILLLKGTLLTSSNTFSTLNEAGNLLPKSDVYSSGRPRKAAEEAHAAAFASALNEWQTGDLPSKLQAVSASCTPRDVTDAIIRMDDRRQSLEEEVAVIDVGANGGYPVTRLALERGIDWTLSIEPDMRNFKRLMVLHPKEKHVSYIAVHGAVSNQTAEMNMKFHKLRNDFTCFDCLDVRKDEVFTEKVDAWTLDGLLYNGDLKSAQVQSDVPLNEMDGIGKAAVLLLKTDTQGHEREVLQGARRLLGARRVENVLMEFDPKLFRTKENAIGAVTELLDIGMQCTHLQFAGMTSEERTRLSLSDVTFGRAVTKESLDAFYAYVVKLDKYTDLFCSKRPALT